MSEAAVSCIDKAKKELELLSVELWNNPEIALEEHKAHALLTDYLEKKGFTVERRYCEMETAFRARWESVGIHVYYVKVVSFAQ